MYRKAHIHFVGIGGIGMSGIATILRTQGYTISGCDADMDQKSIKDLKAAGCLIFEGNNSTACQEAAIDILVYSSAIRPHNPEITAAQQRGIPTIARAMMLAELMRTKFSIAIAGAHGKTTTTSLISHILIEAKRDPTVIVGGHLKNIGVNARLGTGDFLVCETDESDRSLATLHPTIGVITNIDLEHLETYKDLDDIKATFRQFINNIPFYGKAIICADDENLKSLLPIAHIKTVKYGLDAQCDIYGQDLQLYADHSTFAVYQKDRLLGSIELSMPGRHNILNALGAITAALDLEIPFEIIAQALKNFKGIERRFCFKGLFQGAEVFDDYGHHPQEIFNTLLVAKKRAKKKLTVVFQPHRYSRTDKLWHQFIELFKQSKIDHLIVTDIYPASEAPIPGVTSEKLVKELKECNLPFSIDYAPYEADFMTIKEKLKSYACEDDLILLQGAGKINKLADYLS
jgi:UDP-N-acetylmuramate--alanine ligase